MIKWTFVVAALVLYSDCAECSENPLTDWLFPNAEVLRSPEFDDVSTFKEDDIAQIDAWLQQQVKHAGYPSLSVAVTRGGKVIYQRAFGFRDIESQTKATPETSYHVASVTKVFTALLAVMLHEQGVVDLDQPVLKYLPEGVSISTKPEIGATITLRQLASHTSGLPRRVPGRVQSVEGRYELEPERLYKQLARVTLASDPGTEELYSNLGMGLLGHALERAAGKPFNKLLQETVCDKLGLERTAIDASGKLQLATGYSSESPRLPETHSFRKRLAPSGGLIASAPDLANFLSAHMQPGVLSADMLKQLHTPSQLLDGTTVGTSLGWSVRSRISTGRILKKNGGRNNCSAWIGFAPDHKLGVAVLTNCGEPSVDAVGYWLLERSVPGGRKLVSKHGYAKVAPFTGVRWNNDRPVVRVNGDWFDLVSIDGIPIERIVKFANTEFGEKSHKRVSEDLVEVLSKMGHEPRWDVKLGLKGSNGQIQQLQVRMTEVNRARVLIENRARAPK